MYALLSPLIVQPFAVFNHSCSFLDVTPAHEFFLINRYAVLIAHQKDFSVLFAVLHDWISQWCV